MHLLAITDLGIATLVRLRRSPCRSSSPFLERILPPADSLVVDIGRYGNGFAGVQRTPACTPSQIPAAAAHRARPVLPPADRSTSFQKAAQPPSAATAAMSAGGPSSSRPPLPHSAPPTHTTGILYALVARGAVVLAEHSAVSGNSSVVAVGLLQKVISGLNGKMQSLRCPTGSLYESNCTVVVDQSINVQPPRRCACRCRPMRASAPAGRRGSTSSTCWWPAG